MERQLIDLAQTEDWAVEALRVMWLTYVYELAFCHFEDEVDAWEYTTMWWGKVVKLLKAGKGPDGRAQFGTWLRTVVRLRMNGVWRKLYKERVDVFDQGYLYSYDDDREDTEDDGLTRATVNKWDMC